MTKRKLKVTVSEAGVITEEPIQSKIRDLKVDLRKNNKEKINTRRSEKEELLKVMRDRKERDRSNSNSNSNNQQLRRRQQEDDEMDQEYLNQQDNYE